MYLKLLTAGILFFWRCQLLAGVESPFRLAIGAFGGVGYASGMASVSTSLWGDSYLSAHYYSATGVKGVPALDISFPIWQLTKYRYWEFGIGFAQTKAGDDQSGCVEDPADASGYRCFAKSYDAVYLAGSLDLMYVHNFGWGYWFFRPLTLMYPVKTLQSEETTFATKRYYNSTVYVDEKNLHNAMDYAASQDMVKLSGFLLMFGVGVAL